MRRAVIATFLIACLLSCGVGVWALRNTMIESFMLPDATDLVVTTRGLSSFVIGYRAGAYPDAWRSDMAQRLASGGWRAQEYTFGFTRRFTATSYRRAFDLGPVTILEIAVVGGDPQDPYAVHIRVHRELHVADWLN